MKFASTNESDNYRLRMRMGFCQLFHEKIFEFYDVRKQTPTTWEI